MMTLILSANAFAQNDVVRAPGDNPLRNLSRGLKLQAEPQTPPDWVVKTRKPVEELRYIPTGAAARTEPAPLMKLDRVREIERELDAARARHDALSKRTAAPAAKRSVALERTTKKKTVARPCVLTCQSPIGGKKKR